MTTRIASHAGSWYSNNPNVIKCQLSEFLTTPCNKNTPSTMSTSTMIPSAIISPHAGYSYSGSTAGSAFREGLDKRLQLDEISNGLRQLHTIYVLHPSHHVYLPGVAASECDIIETPLGNINVDRSRLDQICEQLRAVGVNVQEMSASTDSAEHSSEMQYPFIKMLLDKRGRNDDVKVVPLMIGSSKDAGKIGGVLAGYLFEEGR